MSSIGVAEAILTMGILIILITFIGTYCAVEHSKKN